MDREQLFQNLSELEKQLKGIKSATEQVNSVVAANRETIAAVNDYTAKAQEILGSVRSVYDGDVAQIKKAAVDALAKSASDFVTKVNSIASDLIRNTEGLKTMVEGTLKPLVKDDLVGLIDTDLKPFVKNEMPETFRSFIDEYNTHFGSTLDALKTATENFSTEASTAISSIGNIKEVVEGSQKSILSSVSSMKETVDAMKTQIDRDVEVSQKAGEDTQKAAEKIDKVSESFDSATKDIKKAIEDGSTKAVDGISGARSSIEDKITAVAGQSSAAITTRIDSVNASLNALILGISSDVDSIKKSLKEVKDVGGDVKSIAKHVGTLEKEVEDLKKSNSTLKILLMIAILLQFVTPLIPVVLKMAGLIK